MMRYEAEVKYTDPAFWNPYVFLDRCTKIALFGIEKLQELTAVLFGSPFYRKGRVGRWGIGREFSRKERICTLMQLLDHFKAVLLRKYHFPFGNELPIVFGTGSERIDRYKLLDRSIGYSSSLLLFKKLKLILAHLF
jgi:hypothetical protein